MIGLLSIFAAVVFWLVVGFALQTIVTTARSMKSQREANHWDHLNPAAVERRLALYKELLGPEDDPKNHWSRGPYGGLPDEE